MELLNKKYIVLLLLVCPFLLSNKECKRDVTWGKQQIDYYNIWKENHEGMDASASCADCHEDQRSPTNPPKSHNSHDIAWKTQHGKYATMRFDIRKENICGLCHQDSFCTTCHKQEKPKNHTNFWKLRGHGLAMGLDRDNCSVCHAGADFCVRCHGQTKPRDHNALWGSSRNLHCNSCHLPIGNTDSQRCAVCHKSTSSHNSAPTPPVRAFHVAGADCTLCHNNISHVDNGTACTVCHSL